MRWSYTRESLAEAIAASGIGKGDIVLSHLAPPALGFSKESLTTGDVAPAILGAVMDVIGPTGSFITPAFSYSFCNREVFDPDTSPSRIGGFSEWFRQQEGVVRSEDPIFSVVGIGPHVRELFHALPKDCFGPDCIYDRLQANGAKACMIGLDMFYLTALHHIEKTAGVTHRFDKLFTGHILRNGSLDKEAWLYFVRADIPNTYPDFSMANRTGMEKGLIRQAPVGNGFVWSAGLKDMFDHCHRLLAVDSWALAAGPACDVVTAERKRTGCAQFDVGLRAEASMEEMIHALWRLPRDIVSDGYDAALLALSGQADMTLHSFPSGSEAFTWIVPERWRCESAQLRTLGDDVLLDAQDNPLHCMSYSLPFDGEIGRDELLAHLHSSAKVPEAVPFAYKYYDRDWGLACSQRFKNSLDEDRYRVVIDSRFSFGELKVGEAVARGSNGKSIILCAHLCHPRMVNDDLAGVVAGISVIRELQKRDDLRFTYRLLLLPETIGSAAWLAKHMDLVPSIKGGMFLEMLATRHPHALQHSNFPDSRMDAAAELAMKQLDPQSWASDFMTLPLNDERMFNSNGIEVPMVSLMRVLPRGEPDAPYREYHTSLDDPDHADFTKLKESKDLILAIVDTLETDLVPVPQYKGELFVSRFSSLDYDTMFKLIMSVPYAMDGKRTVSEIARMTGHGFNEVRDFLDRLYSEGLILYKEPS